MSASILAKTFVRVGARRGVEVEVHLTLLPATAIFAAASPSARIVGAAVVVALAVATLAELRAAGRGVTLRITPLGLGPAGAGVLERGRAATAGARAFFWLAAAALVAWAAARAWAPSLADGALLAAAGAGGLFVLSILPTELLGGRAIWRAAAARARIPLPRGRTIMVLPDDAPPASDWAVEEAERIAKAELGRLRVERAEQTKRR